MVVALVRAIGGRYSAELGIDVDSGSAEIERWFVAATLFGTRISARTAERTFRVLDGAGLHRIVEAGDRPWEELVALLDEGGYARYDFRTATRLQALAETITVRYKGRVPAIAASTGSPSELEAALDALPGWGSVTVSLFLRELRGVWPNANPPLDERAHQAADHLGLLRGGRPPLVQLRQLASEAGVDLRDVEAALVRLCLAHGRDFAGCPGGNACIELDAGATQPRSAAATPSTASATSSGRRRL